MTEARGAVFVSHASDDTEAARRLCEALRAGGIEVWLDESELRLEDRAARGEFGVGLSRLVLELGSNSCERVPLYRGDPEVDRLHRKLYGW